MLYSKISNELHAVSSEIARIRQQLKDFPTGHLSCLHNGKYVKWYQSEKGKRTLIPKKNIEFARQLALKQYLSSLLLDFIQEQKSLNSYLNQYKNYQSHVEQLLSNPHYCELMPNSIQPLSEESSQWAIASFTKSTFHPEQLKFHSISGNILRSKSEVLIDQALFHNLIPFRYECLLKLDEVTLFPDFTIRHPITGAIIYWEHFGMMDVPSYAQNAFQKISLYTSHGYIPCNNLITTFETKEHPLDIRYVEVLIKHYFM